MRFPPLKRMFRDTWLTWRIAKEICTFYYCNLFRYQGIKDWYWVQCSLEHNGRAVLSCRYVFLRLALGVLYFILVNVISNRQYRRWPGRPARLMRVEMVKAEVKQEIYPPRPTPFTFFILTWCLSFSSRNNRHFLLNQEWNLAILLSDTRTLLVAWPISASQLLPEDTAARSTFLGEWMNELVSICMHTLLYLVIQFLCSLFHTLPIRLVFWFCTAVNSFYEENHPKWPQTSEGWLIPPVPSLGLGMEQVVSINLPMSVKVTDVCTLPNYTLDRKYTALFSNCSKMYCSGQQ